MDGNYISFAAIRGVQAGSAYYVVMVPLKSLPLLFKFDDDAVPADLRAQRVLNKSRVPQIADYVISNPDEYILSSLCGSVDGEIAFEAAASEGPLRAVGQLRISLDATILINDGQHRRAALVQALRERPTLASETISVVLFVDRGLRRAQQMFADLNIHAVRPNSSIKLLYDHRDDLAGLTREVVKQVPLFRDFTCFDSASISNRSVKFFTFSALHQANAVFLGKGRNAAVDAGDLPLVLRFWNRVIEEMPDWQRVGTRQVAAAELRQDYIHAHGVGVQAIAIAGAQLLAIHPQDWEPKLSGLRNVDWSRANRALWDGRAIVTGKVNRSKNSIILVSNVVIRGLGLPLGEAAQKIEDLYAPENGRELKAAS
ncbi:DNA sulfur modification protein DndB [Rhizobium leguminosarum]|uniref:DNA sulfur modification protein DndB n=1 Tax=Rhizobium leguminosarum TaxID=384 RepID=UPI00102F3CD7|nr:DNA sulfur modification protein DndB [Rhizobium leguminosarum]TBF37000.1 DNA sulfur modification protein DndB [Rhizobium leguminosarum]